MNLLLLVCVYISFAKAVTLTRYVAGEGVEDEFAAYLEELYRQTEIVEATDSFSDFFVPDGKLILRDVIFTGRPEIVRKKQQLLPLSGVMSWDHYPNVTTVYSETETVKVYNVLGIINRDVKNVNCSSAYYATRFTVKKTEDGQIDLTPHSGNLISYDDYIIDPPYVPTSIPCAK